MYKIAMLFAHWDGEPWSHPIGILNELGSRGHEITKFNCYHDDGRLPADGSHRKYSAAGLLQLVQHHRDYGYDPDFVFVMDYGPYYVPFLGKQSVDTLWILESGDEPQAHRQHWGKASLFDIILSPDWECAERYKNILKKKAYWWTHCADTSIFKPYDDIDEEFDVVTTCGPRGYGELAGLTESIADSLGDRFSNERFFWGIDHAKRLNKGKIVLQCSQHQEITRRIFEGMACGKMVLTDRLPSITHIDDLFVEGEDIIYYDSIQDAIDKAIYFSKNDAERKSIAENGMKKVWEHHSMISRIDFLEEVIEEYLGVFHDQQ